MDGCYLAAKIKPFLYVNDAEEFNPILMVQVENEYGSYAMYRQRKMMQNICSI